MIKKIYCFKLKAKRILLFFWFLFMIYMLVRFPLPCLEAGKSAIKLCLTVIFPSIFPFMVISRLMICQGYDRVLGRFLAPVMGPMFSVRGSGVLAVILGIISGYPVGAKTATDLYQNGEIDKGEASRLLAFCNNSGPLFIIAAVGTGMLGNPKLGYLLYVIHILAAFTTGYVFRFFSPNKASTESLFKNREFVRGGFMFEFNESIKSSVKTMLEVCGYIIFFSIFIKLLELSGIVAVLTRFLATVLFLFQVDPNLIDGILSGFVEITAGSHIIASSAASFTAKTTAISLILGFSGISVLFQVAGVIHSSGLSIKPYLLGKALNSVFAFFYSLILCRFFVPAQTVFNVDSSALISAKLSFFTALGFSLKTCLVLFTIVLILKLIKQTKCFYYK